MSEVRNSEESDSSPEMEAKAADTVGDFLPQKSQERYNLTYAKFYDWQKSRKIDVISEQVMVTYFEELARKHQPSTLWAQFSMLKSILISKFNTNIGKYQTLMELLKRKWNGYESAKSKTLSAQDVEKFLKEAPDAKYLATKTALILGVCGACRGCELTHLTTEDVEEQEGIFMVTIRDPETKKLRSFTIENDLYDIVAKYIGLRPPDVSHNRFFLNYQRGKCTRQPIGKNKIAAMPKEIAKYLKLEDSQSYTGRTFRRTSAELLADSGANATTIKRYGGWRTDKLPKKYLKDPVGKRRKIGQMITSSINLKSKESDDNSNELGDLTMENIKVEVCTLEIDDSVAIEETYEETSETEENDPLSIDPSDSSSTNCQQNTFE